ncbi:helix-turn-helix transcriptional regulator [Paenibacillus sp. UMB7766-LJ446]|uniref:helix-turn-helix domain-containing protein n=1 Tax=Paenibacillus sp. UMB7766-LJ446 TaxID=3046313 RepID=UPI00254BA6EE|nr:helix-turn-helix transcriptional regulator [Paenibacillus sp. UMB7766-LJ446]MDK8189003.1 helix-turn-helix transcriptional regulator [Paenibacillus sp. UMB7766-LJ446]
MYEILERLLKEHDMTAYRLAQETGVSTATLTGWKQGKYTPKRDKLQKIADYFGVKVGYLTGEENRETETNSDAPYHELNTKDEIDIAKDLERIMNNLESNHALAFYGEEAEFDDEAKELLRIQLEQTMRMAKQMAKKKFTPKKYRND